MANTFSNNKDLQTFIAKGAAQMFKDKAVFCNQIDMEPAETFNGANGYKAGQTIKIVKPARFIPGSTADLTGNIQDVTEETTTLTLDTLSNVGVKATSAEFATEISTKSWMKRVLEPAVSSIAQDVEKRFLQKAYRNVFNAVGSPGSTTFNTALSLSAKQKIREFACPDEDNTRMMMSPAATSSAVNARNSLQNPGADISKQYKKGLIFQADGFDYFTNNLMPTHINGSDVTGVAVDQTVSEGATTIQVDGLDASTTGVVKAGTVFTMNGVNAVHPITKQSLGYAQQFVLTQDADSNSSGEATLSFYPAMYASATDGRCTVTALPSEDDPISFIGSASGSYRQSLAFHKNAFRMVSVPLIKPEGTHMSAQETVDGITMRVVMDYQVLPDEMIMRLDFLGGLASVRPEWACRVYE